MNRTSAILLGLLAVQALLAVVLWTGRADIETRDVSAPMFDLGAGVAAIEIEDADGRSARVSRGADGWVLPALEGFPADGVRIDRLVEQLGALQQGAPVATSSAAHARFSVAEDGFERRVTLELDGDDDVVFFAGDTPGVRELYVRPANETGVFRVALGVFELSADIADWEDKTAVQVAADDVERVVVAGLDIRRAEAADGADTAGEWTASPPPDAPLRADAVQSLVDRLAGLRIGAVVGREPPGGWSLDSPALVAELGLTGGRSVSYRFFAHPDGGSYLVQVSSRPEYFTMPVFAAEDVIDAAARDALLALPQADDPADDASSGS